MREIQKVSVALTGQQVMTLKTAVDSGEYATTSEIVREAHLHLPPTFGDAELTRQLNLTDDLAPDNTSIRYGIYAKLISEEVAADETTPSVIAAQVRKVRIVPAHSNTTFGISAETRSKMRKEKTIHSGFMYAKKSGLTLEAGQPPALYLPKLDSTSSSSISGVARIHMRFDPADDTCKPPKPDKLVAILQTYTLFASTTRHNFPVIASAHIDSSQFTHSHHRVLSRRSVAGVEWKIHNDYNSCPPSHINGTSPSYSFIPQPSKIYRGGLFYTTEILIPIALPSDTTFVPSFHSCMLSRIYSLELFLSMYGGITGSDMEVTIPVQILAPSLRERQPSTNYCSDTDYAAPPPDEEESDFLSRMFSSRQNSVGYEHHGGRLDALPAYSQ